MKRKIKTSIKCRNCSYKVIIVSKLDTPTSKNNEVIRTREKFRREGWYSNGGPPGIIIDNWYCPSCMEMFEQHVNSDKNVDEFVSPSMEVKLSEIYQHQGFNSEITDSFPAPGEDNDIDKPEKILEATE